MEDQVTEKVISRLKKMLALANNAGATEGERDAALQQSYKLLAKYNLTMQQVDSHNDTPQEQRQSLQATFPVYPWARQIAGQVADLFFCKYYYIRLGVGKQATHVFIGKESNVATAQYMAEFVVRSVMREAAKMYGSAIAPEARNFAVGVVSKLYDRVREIKAAFNTAEEPTTTGTALVLASLYKTEAEANAAWLAAQGTKLRKGVNRQKEVTDTDAFRAGRDFGGKVSLAPQIGGGTRDNVRRLA